MIYKLKLYNTTFITSDKKNNNYGRDQILLFGKYNTTSNQLVLKRILIKPYVDFAIDRFKYLNNSSNAPHSASINFHAVSSILLNLTITYTIHLMTSDWVQGFGSTIGLNDIARKQSGASWYTCNGYEKWLNEGGDYNALPIASGSIQYYDSMKDLDICVPCMNLNSNYGYILIPSSLSGQVNYLSSNQLLSINIKPNILLKYDDYIYTTGSMLVADNVNKLLLVSFKNNALMAPYSKQRYFLDINYLYENTNVSTSSVLKKLLAIPSNSCYLIVLFKTKLVVIQKDLIYTRISCNGLYNYFDLITNYFLKSKYYTVNVYMNGIKYLTGYRFRVL